MKICFVHRDPEGGGTSIEEIFRGLSEMLEGKADIQQFYYDSRFSLFQNIWRLRKKKADVYHISGGVYHLAPFLYKQKVILTIHDIGRYKELSGMKKWIYGQILLKWPLRRADAITTVSEFTRNDLVKRFGQRISRKLQVIPNPVPKLFRSDVKAFNIVEPRILQIGTGLNKNLITVIKAISGMRVTLVIIGELSDEHKELLKEKAIQYENFSDLEYKEVYEQYCLSDLVVFVSTHEGFGMPVLEAQAAGRPVIASEITSIPEVGGRGVHYIRDPMNSDEIKEGIMKVINDEMYRNSLIHEGFRNIERFDPHKVAMAYYKLYTAV